MSTKRVNEDASLDKDLNETPPLQDKTQDNTQEVANGIENASQEAVEADPWANDTGNLYTDGVKPAENVPRT